MPQLALSCQKFGAWSSVRNPAYLLVRIKPSTILQAPGIHFRLCRRSRHSSMQRKTHGVSISLDTNGITALTCRTILWVRSEEHTSELQSLLRISYAVFCLQKK